MSVMVRTALVFFATGIFLFLMNFYLLRYHARKAALEGKRVRGARDARLWGRKGKEGIVPKWVSYVGLLAFVSFFMGVFLLLARGVWTLFTG